MKRFSLFGHRFELGLRIIMEPSQKAALELWVRRLRRGMLGIPDREGFATQERIISLDDRFRLAESKVSIEPRIERRPRDRVVVMREMLSPLEHDGIGCLHELVQLLELGKSLRSHFDSPVVRRGEALRLRRKQGREL